mgnify:CR=1 FL=1
MRRQEGISLVEILIGLFLTTLLIAVMMQLYLANKRQYNQVQTLLEQSFELHAVMDLIRDSVRKAGFTPCIGLNALETLEGRSNQVRLKAVELSGDKSQELVIKRMSDHFTTVIEAISPAELLVKPELSLRSQQRLLFADCFHAEVAEVLQVQKMGRGVLLKLIRPLSFKYIAPIYLGEWLEEKFFMQKNKQGYPALYYQLNHAEELTSQVKKMSIALRANQGKTLVKMSLGLDKEQKLDLETQVRAEG